MVKIEPYCATSVFNPSAYSQAVKVTDTLEPEPAPLAGQRVAVRSSLYFWVSFWVVPCMLIRNGIEGIGRDPMGRSDAEDYDEIGRLLQIAIVGDHRTCREAR